MSIPDGLPAQSPPAVPVPKTITLSTGRAVTFRAPKNARALYGIKLARLADADLADFEPLVPRVSDLSPSEFGDLALADVMAVLAEVGAVLGEWQAAVGSSTSPTPGS